MTVSSFIAIDKENAWRVLLQPFVEEHTKPLNEGLIFEKYKKLCSYARNRQIISYLHLNKFQAYDICFCAVSIKLIK